MPIVRTYDDPSAFLGLAYQSGQAAGRADRMAQQRAIDAAFIAEQQASRNRLVEMQSAANLSRSLDRGAGGGGEDDPVRTFLSGEASEATKRRQARERAMAEADIELATMQEKRGGILQALDRAYSGKPRDLTYYVARDQVLSGKQVDDRILYSLGIKSGSEEMAEQREARLQSGQSETAGQPRTAQERVFRRTLEQGRGADLADLLTERSAAPKGSPYGSVGPYTSDALAARAQVADFVEQATSRETLTQLRDALGEKADDPTRSMIEGRIRELEQEEIDVKAPAAFEQAMETFQARLATMQRTTGGPLGLKEQQAELAKILSTTAEAYGLDIKTFREWYRANQAAQRAARLAAQNPQAAGMPNGAPDQAPPPGTTPARPVSGQGRPDWLKQQLEQSPNPAADYIPGIGPQQR